MIKYKEKEGSWGLGKTVQEEAEGLIWAYLLCPVKRGLDPGRGKMKVSRKTHFISHKRPQRV